MQYNILHNVYRSPHIYSKYTTGVSPNCPKYKTTIKPRQHCLWECNRIQLFWKATRREVSWWSGGTTAPTVMPIRKYTRLFEGTQRNSSVSLNASWKGYNDEVGWGWFSFCSTEEISDIWCCHFRKAETLYWWRDSSFFLEENKRNYWIFEEWSEEQSAMKIMDWAEGLVCSRTTLLFNTSVLCWCGERYVWFPGPFIQILWIWNWVVDVVILFLKINKENVKK